MFEELEKIELAEEVFGTDFPLDLIEALTVNSPREVVDYLALPLKGWGPNRTAADLLKQLATKRNSPALAQGLHDSWRREQISAVIQQIFNIGDHSAGGDDSATPARKPRAPKSGGRAAAQNLDDDNPS